MMFLFESPDFVSGLFFFRVFCYRISVLGYVFNHEGAKVIDYLFFFLGYVFSHEGAKARSFLFSVMPFDKLRVKLLWVISVDIETVFSLSGCGAIARNEAIS